VTVSHADGCYEYTASSMVRWLDENPLVLGIFLLIIGPMVAMTGKRLFPYISAFIGGFALVASVMLFSGAMGWLSEWWIVFLVLALAIALGALFGVFIKRNMWFAVGTVGVVGGLFLGAALYSLLLNWFGWESYWGFWSITIAVAVIGGILSCKFNSMIVILATSFFGSYIFVTGLNYIFGGSPGLVTMVAKLENDEPVVFTGATYIYLVVLVCLFTFTAVWQSYKEEEHEELKKHTQKTDEVEPFVRA